MHELNMLSTNSFAVARPLVDGDPGHPGLHAVVTVIPEPKRERAVALVLAASDQAPKPEIALKIAQLPPRGGVGPRGRNAPQHAAPECKAELVDATALIALVQALILETVTNAIATTMLLETVIGWL